MQIILNKKDKNIPKDTSLKDLISLLKLNPDGIVTEVNLGIIKKEKRENFILKDSDSVEIITFMGGG